MARKFPLTAACFTLTCWIIFYFLPISRFSFIAFAEISPTKFFERFLGEKFPLDVVWFTLWQSLTCASVVTLLGAVLASILPFQNKFFLRIWDKLAILPYVVPSIIFCFGFIATFGNAGLLGKYWSQINPNFPLLYNKWALLCIHTLMNLTFATHFYFGLLKDIHYQYDINFKILKLPFLRRFLKIEFPYLAPTMIWIFCLVTSLCLTSFLPVLLISGHHEFNTLEVAIYQALRYDGDIVLALFLCIVQFLIIGIILFVGNTLFAQKRRISLSRLSKNPESIYKKSPFEISISPPKIFLLPGTVFLVLIFIASLLPLFSLILSGLQQLNEALFTRRMLADTPIKNLPLWYTSKFWFMSLEAMVRSFSTSSATAFLTSFYAYFATKTFCIMLSWNKKLAFIFKSSHWIFQSFSPSVLAAVWFVFVNQDLQFETVELPTILQIITVQTGLYAPLAFLIFEARASEGLNLIETQRAILGFSIIASFRNLEWPLLKSSFLSTFLIVFAITIGDATVVSIFSSKDFVTIPRLILQLMGGYRFQDASVLVALFTIFYVLLFYFSHRARKLKS